MDLPEDAAQRPPSANRSPDRRRSADRFSIGQLSIGRLAVLVAFLLLLASLLLGAPSWVSTIFQAGFIGGFTNTVAIHMLFVKTWYLPGSGVLLERKDAIVASLAATMEEHILNPSLIEERVRLLSRSIDYDRVIDGLNAVIDELRLDLIRFLHEPEQRRRIRDAVQQEGSFWSDMADVVGVVRYENIADRIVAGLETQILEFRLDRAMLDAAVGYVGSLEDFLLEPNNPLILRHYGSEMSAAQLVFHKLDARQLVIDKLSAYEAEQIRDIVSRNIREHLSWLEFFGVLLGMGIAALVLLAGNFAG